MHIELQHAQVQPFKSSPLLCLHVYSLQKMDEIINNLTVWQRCKINPTLLLITGSFYTITTRVMVSSIDLEYEPFSKGHGSVWVINFVLVTVEVSERTPCWGVSEWCIAYNGEVLSISPTKTFASLSIWGTDMLLSLSRNITCVKCDEVPLLWSSKNIVRWEVCALSFHRATVILSNNGKMETCHEKYQENKICLLFTELYIYYFPLFWYIFLSSAVMYLRVLSLSILTCTLTLHFPNPFINNISPFHKHGPHKTSFSPKSEFHSYTYCCSFFWLPPIGWEHLLKRSLFFYFIFFTMG